MEIFNRLKQAWNVFKNKDPTHNYMDLGMSYSYRPDRMRYTRGKERSIITSILNRISMDAAAISVKHVRLDENGRFLDEIDSGLNNCLNVEANIDQSGRAFIQDLVASMLDEGCVAAVPIDTDDEPEDSGNFKIYSMRTGKILEWFPRHVKLEVYNDIKGKREEILVPKSTVAIIENPFYSVMNEPNSTMQRLMRKLSLLDIADEKASNGKLDLIIQLPYVVKTEARKQQAEIRRKELENQLTQGSYGIAYTDSTERITQLNRPVENNLMRQIEYLTNLLYSQLGMKIEIMDGSADAETMQNYYNRMIEPILSAITDEMRRKFLTKTARTQRQTVTFFRDPFKLAPITQLAEIADKFTRNEIMTSNEMRQIVGMKPSEDPNADVLRNKNLGIKQWEEASGQAVDGTPIAGNGGGQTETEGENDQNG